MILIDSHPRHGWLVKAVERRLREELAKLRVEINEDKSGMVNLAKGESFTFLGFEYRRIRSRNRVWRPYYAPKLKKRTALFAKLREIFRRNVSQPVGKVIELINPILRGWVNYFRVGDSNRCFSMVKNWVEKKIRRHLMRARGRKGMAGSGGVGNGSTAHSGCLTIIEWAGSHSRKLPQGHTLHKPWHEAIRKAHCGKPARWFEAAGIGNGLTVRLVRHSQRKRGATDRLNLRSTAPVLDPTDRQQLAGRWRPRVDAGHEAGYRRGR